MWAGSEVFTGEFTKKNKTATKILIQVYHEVQKKKRRCF